MNFEAIDWNALWREESAHSHWNKGSQKDLWNKRADSFSRRISRVVNGKEDLDKDDYISKMLARVEVRPDWSLLDIGCGPGTLAIPLAKKAKFVTALDLSSEMLKHLKENADKAGLNNIHYLNASWQEALDNKQVGPHDVVVASRSLMSGDMKEALSGIISVAGKVVYLTFPIVHLPFDWEVYRDIGRNNKKHPPYIYIYNMLYRMGVQANVEVLNSKIKVQFPSVESAIEDLQWRTDPFTADELVKLKDYLRQQSAGQKDPAALAHEGYSKWALIWWKKEEQ